MSVQAMRQALEALENLQELCSEESGFVEEVTIWTPEAITALRTAIAEAEKQEPVAWMVKAHGLLQRLSRRADVADEIACQYRKDDPKADMFPLYTAPPQRKPLTDEEIVKITSDPCLYIRGGDYRIDIARAIEAAHGIKE